MIRKASAKINLGLYVKRKREDGFHEIESVFHKIPIYDFVELLPAEQDEMFVHNTEVPGDTSENICLKAVQLLRKKNLIQNHYQIHLLKNIPIGAGLGGGSSDATSVISLLNEVEDLNLSKQQLAELSAELGSDCPFFFENEAALVQGRGEKISPIDFSLKGYYLVLIYPNLHISTGEAYGNVDLEKTTKNPLQLDLSPYDWQSNWRNDFELGLFEIYPVLHRIKNELIQLGAFYASMSGSGSTVYGLFRNAPTQEELKKFSEFKLWSIQL